MVSIRLDYFMHKKIKTAAFAPSFDTHLGPALGPTQPPIQCALGALTSDVKQMERKTDHSYPFSAEVKNGVATFALPHTSSWGDA
jgi:hypothetical protein